MSKIKAVVELTNINVNNAVRRIILRPYATINTGGGGGGPVAIDDVTGLSEALFQLGEDVAEKQDAQYINQPGGYAGLGGDGLIFQEQIPELEVEKLGTWQQGQLVGRIGPANGPLQSLTLSQAYSILGLQAAFAAKEDKELKDQPEGYAGLDSGGLISVFALPLHFHELEHVNGLVDALETLDDIKQNVSEKNNANGYAGLDGSGKINPSQLPAIAITDRFVVASEAAMLALTAETGDIAIRTDESKTYILNGSPSVLANWQEMLAPTAAVASVFGRTGIITAQPGDYTTDQVTEATNLFHTAARVRGTALTGYAAAGSRTALAATDTILEALGKVGKYLVDLGSAAFAAATTAGLAMLTAANASDQTALLDTFTSGAKGLAPASGGGTTNFLRADGSWAAPGGGGTPGGSSGEIQYNNGGAFAGAADVEIEGGQLRLPSIATPSVPASGGAKLFGKDLANSPWPHFLAPDGVVPWPVQPYIGDGRFYAWLPIVGGTTASLIGWPAQSVNGTSTTAAIGGGSRRTNAQRMEFLIGSASPSACAHFRIAQAGFGVNGSSSWEGGFRGLMHGAPATGCTNSSHRFFMGLGDSLSMSDVDPSTQTQVVGIGYGSADANLQFMHNDASGACTKIDLGASFAKPTTDRSVWYRLRLYAPPGTARVLYYEVTNLETGAVAVGAVTTNLPPATSYITPKAYGSVGGVSSVVGITMGNIVFITEPQ